MLGGAKRIERVTDAIRMTEYGVNYWCSFTPFTKYEVNNGERRMMCDMFSDALVTLLDSQ